MRHYEPRDLATINEWLAAHKADPLGFDPKIGLIVPGVAFGALVVTDVGYGILSGFVTNPAASSNSRAEALQEITVGILNEAAKHRLKRLYVLTSVPEIAVRAQQGGGTYLGLSMMFGMSLPQ